MLTHSWSEIVRTWCSWGILTRAPSRASIRRRKPQAGHQVSIESLEERLVLSAIVVTSTGDSIAVDGLVTLREALSSINNGVDANADVAGVGVYGTNDAISFNIAGAGVHTIAPGSALPTILKPVAIDGYSQLGASVNTLATTDNAVLLIQLNGTNAGLGSSGLVLGIGSAGSTISGLVINNFSGTGITVQSDTNTITGNFIGTDSTGNLVASVTGTFGVAIEGGFRNTIGGTVPAARNVIGGNSDGINLNTGSQTNVIQGNFIGVGADGTTAVGNRLHGIALRGNGGLGVQNNQIGGTVAGAGNIIANNGFAGVAVFGDPLASRQNTGNSILGNSIYNNGLSSPATLPGIDLVGTFSYPTDDGVTLNDNDDGDSGPNDLQNYPVLTSATSNLISTTISGSLNSNPETTYRIEFFSSPTLSGTGFGEGKTFLGFTNVTTDALGDAAFNATVAATVSNGHFVTATATAAGPSTGTGATGAASVLGSASTFAILAATTITFSNPSVVFGDVGLFPGSVIVGLYTATGETHVADPVASQAQTDLVAAYNFYEGLTPFIDLTGQELGGMTLTPGIYHFDTSAQLTGPLPLTLDTQGDPHAQFVFQIGSTLTTAAGVGSAVVTAGGPSDNIVWQVGSSATIGVGTAFVGNILALTSITLETGASLSSGRALARNGAVTLDSVVADSGTASQSNTSEFSAPAQIVIPTVTLSVAPLTIAEATGQSTVTATLSSVSGQDVTVNLAFAGTATNVTDYTRSGTQIVIPAGQLIGTVTLDAVQDLLIEGDETIVVDINSVTNGTENGTQQVTATILDDEVTPAPSVTLNVVPATLVEATGQSTVTATLSVVSGQDVIVDLLFTGTATNISDYIRSGTQIVIPAGQLSGAVTLDAVQDLLVEGDETIVVDINSVTNGTENGTQQVTATILDDDVPLQPSVTLSIAPATLAEAGGTSTITATISTVSGQDVTIGLGFTGTATNIADYTRSGTQIVIPAGQLIGTVTVNAVSDVLIEGDETIVVDIISVTNGTENGTQQVTATLLDGTTTVNGSPVSSNDAYFVNEDAILTVVPGSGVLVNDTDPENDLLTAVLVTLPQNGIVVLNSDGSFAYTPNADFNGIDSFTYRANDGTTNGNIATVSITVGPLNEAPIIITSPNPQPAKGHARTLLDPAINLIDLDSPSFNGGDLDVAIQSGGGRKDSLGYRHGGANKGRVNVKRGELRIGRTVIGSITGGRRGVPLHVNFNSNATQERVEVAMQNLIFRGTTSQPGQRVISWQITDDTGLDSNVATKIADVT